MSDGRDNRWATLGSVSPRALAEARIQLHWAAQTIAAAADAVLEPRADDSHTAMRWDEARGALLGHPFKGRCVTLEVSELALSVVDDNGGELHRLSLHGHSLATALAWVSEALGTDKTLRLRSHRMPAHVVANGGRFSFDDPAQFAALRAWYSTSIGLLGELALPNARALAVRPRRFDVASIVFLDDDISQPQRQIGFGMSPGDPFYDQPYYYVAPSPMPDHADLPALPAGAHWHTAGFTAAVLTADAIVAGGTADAREALVRGFLADTLTLSAGLLTTRTS
ncbi:MAG TPA: hypothetical protein VML75_29245 [Kofleriaceae bacterium]|nr:hypothetical protein [Kofleriaceae bacterium]